MPKENLRNVQRLCELKTRGLRAQGLWVVGEVGEVGKNLRKPRRN